MNTLILAFALFMAGAAIISSVAFCLGWFRLAAVPTQNKGQFVLMRKTDTIREDAKSDPANAKSSGLPTTESPSPNEIDR